MADNELLTLRPVRMRKIDGVDKNTRRPINGYEANKAEGSAATAKQVILKYKRTCI
jgi:hypothetical protein